MAAPFTPDQPFKDINVINESERSVDPADDEGKLVQLESDGFVSDQFVGVGKTLTGQHSNNVRHNNTPERSTVSGSYVKLKETQITGHSLTKARFRVESYHTITGGGGGFARLAIFVNGVKVSGDIFVGDADTSITTTSYTYFSYDFTGELQSGDLVQVYGRRGNNYPMLYVRNFQICFDALVQKVTGISLDAPLTGVHETFSASSNASF